jgi:hypothetical protein
LGGNYKFDGLNTVKDVSKVHNKLNEIWAIIIIIKFIFY